jgi:hypothetical protein
VIKGLAAALAVAGLVACHAPPPPAPHPIGPVGLITRPAQLNPNDITQSAIGPFRYAGGFSLRSPDTSRLHGLSDLKLDADGLGLHAQGDEGDTLDARIALSPEGRLVGLTAGRMGRLIGPDGHELTTKQHTDAEGLALMPDGSRLVSFERDNRILHYPATGAAPTVAPFPPVTFDENAGVEALTAFPAAGPDAYLAGAEQGQIWLCHLATNCVPLSPIVPPTSGYGLTALAVLPGDGPPRLAVLDRAWDPVQGSRLIVTIVRLTGPMDETLQTHVVGRFEMAAPLTRDNFEGMAATARPNGDIRLYLIADDNFQRSQRTLLMAFDWTPPGAQGR